MFVHYTKSYTKQIVYYTIVHPSNGWGFFVQYHPPFWGEAKRGGFKQNSNTTILMYYPYSATQLELISQPKVPPLYRFYSAAHRSLLRIVDRGSNPLLSLTLQSIQ